MKGVFYFRLTPYDVLEPGQTAGDADAADYEQHVIVASFKSRVNAAVGPIDPDAGLAVRFLRSVLLEAGCEALAGSYEESQCLSILRTRGSPCDSERVIDEQRNLRESQKAM